MRHGRRHYMEYCRWRRNGGNAGYKLRLYGSDLHDCGKGRRRRDGLVCGVCGVVGRTGLGSSK